MKPAPIAPRVVYSLTDEKYEDHMVAEEGERLRLIRIYHTCLPDDGLHYLGDWDWGRGCMTRRDDGGTGEMVPIAIPRECQMCLTRIVEEEWESIFRFIHWDTKHWEKPEPRQVPANQPPPEGGWKL